MGAIKPDLTHQHVARVLLQDHAHRFTKKQLKFLQSMTRVEWMTEGQEQYLADLDRRRLEAVR